MSEHSLEIRLLGEPAILRSGHALVLPPSKKTRALLVYLVASGRSHSRERLCDLLWEGPDDPRGALRWSLAKLRQLFDAGAGCPLVSERDCIAFAAGTAGIDVDVLRLERLLAHGAPTAGLDALREAAALFRGEFAEGLDLPHCARYHEWCAAERDRWAELRLAVLGRLVDLLADVPEEALVHARTCVAIDPLYEGAHAALIRLLVKVGRQRDALRQYEYCRKLLEAELGVRPGAALEGARALLVDRSAPGAIGVSNHERVGPPHCGTDPGIVGREVEIRAIDSLVAAASARAPAQFVLLTGDSGIGKSCLLRYVGTSVVRAGGEAFSARAYEAEIARPHGVWVDVVAGLGARAMPEAIRVALSPLLADSEAAPVGSDRGRLFTALVALLQELSVRHPVALLIDDLQWIDDASVSLLHYVVRSLDKPGRLVVAATARPGELADNPLAQRMVHALARAGRVVEIAVPPLDAAATAALARTVAPGHDVESVVAASEGNPLFTLELARSLVQGSSTLPQSIGRALAEQLTRLEGPARAVLPWASALGRVFHPSLLERCLTLAAHEWLDALAQMERRGIVRGAGNDRYDFAHDLIRAAAYGQISQPRRRLIHGQIARAIGQALDANEASRTLGGELARHAALAGNDALAARGFALAGDHSLRVFANDEALECAERGLRHLARVATGSDRTQLQIALLRIQIAASSGGGRRPALHEDLLAAAMNAETSGFVADAAAGHYLLAEMHYETGDAVAAGSSSLRAAEIGRGADPATTGTHLATTACCLLLLETEIERSRRLIVEAEGLPGSDRKALWLLRGRALLHRWDGEWDAAVPLLEQAHALANRLEDRWQAGRSRAWLTMVHLERGDASAALACARDLLPQVTQAPENGELPFVRTLEALAQARLGAACAPTSLAAALDELRAFDSKSRLAYALNSAGELAFAAGDLDVVQAFAREALPAAEATRRVCEAVRARVLLTRVLGAAGDRGAARAALAPLLGIAADRNSISEGVRRTVVMAAAELGVGVQTPVHTSV
jgi:DNA-binding SARP family transcriptional activator/predicted ATPase